MDSPHPFAYQRASAGTREPRAWRSVLFHDARRACPPPRLSIFCYENLPAQKTVAKMRSKTPPLTARVRVEPQAGQAAMRLATKVLRPCCPEV